MSLFERDLFGRGGAVARERRQADRFFADLLGRRLRRRHGAAPPFEAAIPPDAEDVTAVAGSPRRTESEWRAAASAGFFGKIPTRGWQKKGSYVLSLVMQPTGAHSSWQDPGAAKKREEVFLEQLLKGNVPNFLRRGRLVTIDFTGRDGRPHSITYQVMPDYLAVGSRQNHVVVPLSPPTAQAIADRFGCILPTALMVDQIFDKATAKVNAPTRDYYMQGGVNKTTGRTLPVYDPTKDSRLATHDYDAYLKRPDCQVSTAAYLEHDLAVKAALAAMGVERAPGMPLVAGYKKDLVIASHPNPRAVQFYGMYHVTTRAGGTVVGTPIQAENGPGTPVNGHNGDPLYVDYSHGVRLVAGTMLVDHSEMTAAEVLAHPVYSWALSKEGPIASPRVPDHPQPAPKESFEAAEDDGAAPAIDPLLAVPPFTAGKRAFAGTPLTPARSKAAIRRNAANHPGQSGVDPASLLKALQRYVDLPAVDAALAAYNARNPQAPIDPGTRPVDAAFVEAIHQFQVKCYRDTRQHDGIAGAAVLDSLGFWPRTGMRASAQTNDWAKERVRSNRQSIADALSQASDLTSGLSASNWWDSFVSPCFLGWGFARPIHVYFARKLRKAELWLLSQPRFAGSTPSDLARLLEIDEEHVGGRDNTASVSMHTLGLATDIKYVGNPHVGDYRDKPNGAQFFTDVIKRAAARISGVTLTEDRFPQYLHKLGTDTAKTTGDIYDELRRRDQDLRTYLALADAKKDLAELRKEGVFVGRQARDPLNGFLNHDRDLVIALRDHACLVWGAVDLGAGASGDIMHFDCRLDDVGRAVFCGTIGSFNDRHPCWRRSDPPCGRGSARAARAASPSREAFESAHEDAAAFVEDDAGAAAPPVMKNPNASDPPGQTIYVEIPLGRDSRCKTRDKTDRSKCAESESFALRPMTGIFIPDGYVPQPAVDIILYLHGHKTDVPGSDALIAEYWDRKYPVFGLREEINDSHMNVILVAPTLALKSEAGDLVRGHGLDTYLGKVLAALKAYGPYQTQSPVLGNLVLAAHSGGGVYMRLLATSRNSTAAAVRECWGFDSLYNSSDVEPWRRWAKGDPQARRLYSYYRGGWPKDNSEALERDPSTGRTDKLPNITTIPSREPDHFKLVRLYLRERLQGTTFLHSTAVKP
jgi:hypothetical protein